MFENEIKKIKEENISYRDKTNKDFQMIKEETANNINNCKAENNKNVKKEIVKFEENMKKYNNENEKN